MSTPPHIYYVFSSTLLASCGVPCASPRVAMTYAGASHSLDRGGAHLCNLLAIGRLPWRDRVPLAHHR
ncbi:hypothetical protein [Nostoc sp.]